MPARSQSDAYRSVFLPTDIKNLNGIASRKQHSFCSNQHSRLNLAEQTSRKKFLFYTLLIKKIQYNCKKVYVTFDFLKPDTIFHTTQ
jgi:hypothetical protein